MSRVGGAKQTEYTNEMILTVELVGVSSVG